MRRNKRGRWRPERRVVYVGISSCHLPVTIAAELYHDRPRCFKSKLTRFRTINARPLTGVSSRIRWITGEYAESLRNLNQIFRGGRGDCPDGKVLGVDLR